MGDFCASDLIVKISSRDRIKIRILSLLWGFWSLLKMLLKKFWNSESKKSFIIGNPPPCLTDSSLGHHSYVKLKGVKLHYVESGEKTRPLVVLLHGFPDCWITWRHQIPELSKHFRVIAVDLKGFGDSDKPEASRHYQIQRVVGELRELVLGVAGGGRCTLVAHDLGALIGWFLVHLHPELIDKFVAVASPHPNLYWDTLPARHPFNTQWVNFCQLPTLPELEALDNDLSIIDNIYGHLNSTKNNISYLNAYKYAFSRREDWTGAVNYFRTLPFWRVSPTAPPVLVPTLLVVGNKDSREFFESVVRSTEFLHNYSLKVVENAARFPHHEKPAEFNRVLLTYLIGNQPFPVPEKPQSNGLVNRMFGAVSSTINYGNSIVFDAVKKGNGLTARALYLGQNS